MTKPTARRPSAQEELRAEIDAWLAAEPSSGENADTSPFVSLKRALGMTNGREAIRWLRKAGFPSVQMGSRVLCRRADFESARDAYLAGKREADAASTSTEARRAS